MEFCECCEMQFGGSGATSNRDSGKVSASRKCTTPFILQRLLTEKNISVITQLPQSQDLALSEC
jgi:hypothetical protein